VRESRQVGQSGRVTDTPYLTPKPSADDRLRLFCFHHAGGGASAFAGLRRAIAGGTGGAGIEVVGVQLPGREGRMRDVLPGTMAEVVAELDDHLDSQLAGEYAFYGHSMGALVAHDLVARRQARGASLPTRLVAGACRAPHLQAAFAAAHGETDDFLTKTMLDIGGLSPQVLSRPAWLQAALSLTRGDLRLCASRDIAAGEPLACPIDVFHGVMDPLVSLTQALPWADRSAVSFALHRFGGGHFFFLREAGDAVASALTGLLTPAQAVDNLLL
jgi:surfactin synthase thioesterase subunit